LHHKASEKLGLFDGKMLQVSKAWRKNVCRRPPIACETEAPAAMESGENIRLPQFRPDRRAYGDNGDGRSPAGLNGGIYREQTILSLN
jgi:hypothetical protein